MPVSSSTEHWIKPDALTINLNHFGDPDYLQVSVLAGAVVMAFKQDVIGYNAAHNYRTWPLEAANTYLETSSAYNVYARLTRSEVNARALIVYDTVLRDIEGREITYAQDGSEVLREASTDYFFVFLGQISESTDRNGGKKERSWNIGLRFGALDTTEQKNYTGFLFEKMFRPHYDDNQNPDKITSIEVLSGLWTYSFISAKGISPNTGGESGSGSIRQVFGYNDLSGNFLNSDLNNTFNAYTIARLASRISYLEQNGGGSGGGGVADSVEWEKVLYKPSWLVDKKPSVSFFNNDAQYITSDALNPYATQQWVNDKGYAIATDVANTYVPKTAFIALKTDFDNLSALLNDDVQGKINTWHEVVDFLDEYSGSQDLAAILSGMNTDIASRVEKSKFAEYFNSEMAKWFVKDDNNKGIKPVNSYGLYSDTYVSAKGVSTGTSGGGGGTSYDRLDSWAEYTSAKAGYVLSALLGYDLHTRVNNLANAGYITASALSGYAKLSDIPTSLPASDVAAWAKAASKPSYAFSEITNKPTTLGGYGITDAYTATTIDGKLSGYLPLSGGTIEDSIGGAFSVNRINASEAYIKLLSRGVFKGGITAGNDTYGVALYNIVNGCYLGITDDGNPYYIGKSRYTLIHSGNIGSQSVSYASSAGDADTLDGYHSTAFTQLYIDNSDNFLSYTNRTRFQTSFITGQGDFCSLVIPTWAGNNENSWYLTELRFETGGGLKIRASKDGNVEYGWKTIATTESNVASATKLQTARTIWGQSFDGTGNVSGVLFDVNQISFDANKSYGIFRGDWITSTMSRDDIGIYSPKIYLGGNVFIRTTTGIGHSTARLQIYNSENEWTSIHYTDNSAVFIAQQLGYGMLITSKSNNSGKYLLSIRYNDSDLMGLGSSALSVFDNGNVGIGTTFPTEKLHVAGNIVATGSVTAKSSSSDIRLKKDLTDYSALEIIKNQRSVMYKWNDVAKANSEVFNTDAWQFGLLAQELQATHPQLVSDVFGDYLTINYERLIPIVWRGVQEVDDEVTRLKAEVQELKNRISIMEGGRYGC